MSAIPATKRTSMAHVSRRLKFRDLQTILAVAQCGSMAKAAAALGVTQPAVSDIIAALESMFAVKLFDRTPAGVEPTVFGRALLARARAAFDEVQQGIRDIELLCDPTTGELKIGCPATVAAAFLPAIITGFGRRYPRVVLHFEDVPGPAREFPGLLERRHDLVVTRIVRPLADERDLNVEILFDDTLVVAADARGPWARRRKISPSELADAPWILTAPDTWIYRSVAEAFHEKGLAMPRIGLVASSGLLRANLLAMGPFVTALPISMVRAAAGIPALKALPVSLPIRGYPLAIGTLKNRALNPLVALFIEHLREIARSMPARP
jgi:DNA-binding transcriptional LysR family regulator